MIPSLSYLNFDLIITYADGQYQAHVDKAPGGDASSAFDLPFPEHDIPDLLRRIDIRRDLAAEELTDSPELRQTGGELFDAVFSGPVRSVFVASKLVAEKGDKALRIRLNFRDQAMELAMLPWEILFDTEQQNYLALSDSLPIVRYLPQPRPLPALGVEPPLSILAVLASPADQETLDVEREWRVMERALASLVAEGSVILERLDPPTFDALAQRLLGEPVHVLHFVGHGLYEPARESGILLFEKADGRSREVQAGALAMLLHNHPALRLVYLNACEGAIGDQGNLFAGIAQTLVRQGVPAAVAMQDEISDDAAIEMARTFYTALATGRPVDAALTHARVALAARGNDEWVIPVLFSRSPDNRLLQLPEGDARMVIERQPWEPETVKIEGGAFIMGSEPGPGVPENETPAHTVTLSVYRIGKYPVTNRAYAAFIAANRSQPAPDGWFLRKPPDDRLDHPVTDVSWHDAVAYCAWLAKEDVTGRRYRLPTEAEWARAARGREGRRYPWGDAWEEGRCNVSGDDTTAVCAFAGGYGENEPVDLLGNVQEWTSTLWGGDLRVNAYPYPYRPDDGREDPDARAHPDKAFRIHRGGSYSSQPDRLYAAARGKAEAKSSSKRRGFRVAMEIG